MFWCFFSEFSVMDTENSFGISVFREFFPEFFLPWSVYVHPL